MVGCIQQSIVYARHLFCRKTKMLNPGNMHAQGFSIKQVIQQNMFSLLKFHFLLTSKWAVINMREGNVRTTVKRYKIKRNHALQKACFASSYIMFLNRLVWLLLFEEFQSLLLIPDHPKREIAGTAVGSALIFPLWKLALMPTC